jgi:protein-disulfide isomerase
VSQKTLWIIVGLVVLLALGGGAYYLLGPGPGPTADAGASSGPGYVLTDHDRSLGNPKAPVVVIEYAAPSCPICAAFNAQSFPQFKQNYIDTGKVYYVFRVFPLRSDDGQAEKIARCLPADKYLAFIDLLFRNQPLWDVENGVTDVHGGLVHVGRIAGMSAEQVDKCMDNPAEDKIINQVAQDGQSKYNITGTPTIVVDGVSMGSRFVPYDQLAKTLDAALAKKKQ